MRVLVFGDSITYGAGLPEGGWVELLRQNFSRKGDFYDAEFYNLAIDGDNSVGVAGRLANEVEARRWHNDSLAVIVLIGMNDSLINNEGEYSTPQEYRRNLEKIAAAVRPPDQIIFGGLTAVDESKSNPFPGSTSGKRYTNERIALFESELIDFTSRSGLPFIALRQIFLNHGELLHDGLHPNLEGQKHIALAFKVAIETLINQNNRAENT